jgi:hypothetical protein
MYRDVDMYCILQTRSRSNKLATISSYNAMCNCPRYSIIQRFFGPLFHIFSVKFLLHGISTNKTLESTSWRELISLLL